MSQSGFLDNSERRDQSITAIDEETVQIKNQFGSRIILTERLAELLWVGDTWEARPMDVFMGLIDQEIAGVN